MVAASFWAGEFLGKVAIDRSATLNRLGFQWVQVGIGAVLLMFGRKLPIVGRYSRELGIGVAASGLWNAASRAGFSGWTTANKIAPRRSGVAGYDDDDGMDGLGAPPQLLGADDDTGLLGLGDPTAMVLSGLAGESTYGGSA